MSGPRGGIGCNLKDRCAREARITHPDPISVPPDSDRRPRQPRARGTAGLKVKARDGRSVIGDLHQKGSLKLLFPRDASDALTAVLLNTAGGVTGGDRYETQMLAGAGTRVCITSQAAERAYRAQPGETGHIRNRIRVEAGARLDWLPQETILFDACALDRGLHASLAADAALLVVEPVIFGRAAMGERLLGASFRDRIDIERDGVPVFADRTRLSGAISADMTRAATGAGAGAMAGIVLAAPGAARLLEPARARIGPAGGASARGDDLLLARLLAPDGFELRRALLPLIELLSGTSLPRTWMI